MKTLEFKKRKTNLIEIEVVVTTGRERGERGLEEGGRNMMIRTNTAI